MSTLDVDNHARTYSQAYRYDLNNSKKSSKWTTDFEAMALKTVIKLLLSKWGILSVDMQNAKVFDEDGNGDYLDNPKEDIPELEEVPDVFAEEETQEQEDKE